MRRFIMTLSILCLFMTSCVERINHKGEDSSEMGGESYAQQFRNYNLVSIDITSEFNNVVYSIFYSFPYEDGSLVAEPYLVGKTPIKTTLNVPSDVTKLYVVGNGRMLELPVKNIVVDDATVVESTVAVQSRAARSNVTSEIIATINSQYFPEKSNNVRGADLYKCTDLKLSNADTSEPYEEADIWLTYLSDGGFSNSRQYGKLWFYTYPSDKMHTLSVSDCMFYGADDQGNIVQVSYEVVLKNNNANLDNGNYIFWSKKENPKAAKGEYDRVKLGRFAKNLNVGFVFKGTEERCQFTTPALNLSIDSHNYQNTSFSYRDGSGSFTPMQPVSNGFICHLSVGAFEGNVLGMENRSTNHKSYDGDYNDMLCMVESNPVSIRPAEPIDPPVVDDHIISKGIYLFEDNYPFQGDFDFNDAVVEYKIVDYTKSDDKRKDISVRLLASGCEYNNFFGYKVGNEYISFIENIKGYYNVYTSYTNDETFERAVTKTIRNNEVRPFLYNGQGYVCDTNYNTGEYPYVLDIPTSDDGFRFAWAKEGISISRAYHFLSPRSTVWYKNPVDQSLIIVR